MNVLNAKPANYRRSKVVPILVVDDSPTLLHAICALLEPQELVEVVGRAADGQEALEAVDSLHPEFVLMDVSMPRMNGLRATRLISRHFPETKVLLMSSEDSPYLREECLTAGAAAFVYKPRFLKELLAAVQADRQSIKIGIQDQESRSRFSRFSSVAAVS
jgi:DNA-binding NarL/FixJ family response regulator